MFQAILKFVNTSYDRFEYPMPGPGNMLHTSIYNRHVYKYVSCFNYLRLNHFKECEGTKSTSNRQHTVE